MISSLEMWALLLVIQLLTLWALGNRTRPLVDSSTIMISRISYALETIALPFLGVAEIKCEW